MHLFDNFIRIYYKTKMVCFDIIQKKILQQNYSLNGIPRIKYTQTPNYNFTLKKKQKGSVFYKEITTTKWYQK